MAKKHFFVVHTMRYISNRNPSKEEIEEKLHAFLSTEGTQKEFVQILMEDNEFKKYCNDRFGGPLVPQRHTPYSDVA